MSERDEGQPSFHLIGAGGAGMSVVAQLLAAQGARVTGSDRQDSDFLTALRNQGLEVYYPHGARDFDPDATVVLSSAIRDDNVELVLARSRGQRVIHRSQALALAAQGHRMVAVAGAHGKTTTSAMLATALLDAGVDASFAIGGDVLGVGTGARIGGDVFVAEADESDGSFLNYSPYLALITNIEADHLDTHGSSESLFHVFEEFTDRIVSGGTLLCCGEDRGSARLAAEMKERSDLRFSVLTYGRSDHCDSPPDIELSDVATSAEQVSGRLSWGAIHQEFNLSVTGAHNALNAAGAWGACVALGVGPTAAAKGLSAFKGAGRRFETKGIVSEKTVIIDYAHHPTEVAAAIKQARLIAGEGKVIVVFQPHLYSRTRSFADRFAKELAGADRVILADIYAAREDPMPGVTSELILEEAPENTDFINGGDAAAAASIGASLTAPGDVLVLMGAGDIYLEAASVLQEWEEVSHSEGRS